MKKILTLYALLIVFQIYKPIHLHQLGLHADRNQFDVYIILLINCLYPDCTVLRTGADKSPGPTSIGLEWFLIHLFY